MKIVQQREMGPKNASIKFRFIICSKNHQRLVIISYISKIFDSLSTGINTKSSSSKIMFKKKLFKYGTSGSCYIIFYLNFF